jgi:hypothetical protein
LRVRSKPFMRSDAIWRAPARLRANGGDSVVARVGMPPSRGECFRSDRIRLFIGHRVWAGRDRPARTERRCGRDGWMGNGPDSGSRAVPAAWASTRARLIFSRRRSFRDRRSGPQRPSRRCSGCLRSRLRRGAPRPRPAVIPYSCIVWHTILMKDRGYRTIRSACRRLDIGSDRLGRPLCEPASRSFLLGSPFALPTSRGRPAIHNCSSDHRR